MTKASRPRKLPGNTFEIKTGCGEVYVTCNDDADGRLFEVFVKLGKSGGCGSATMEGLGRIISVGLRSGTGPLDVVKTLGGIKCHRAPSCLEAVGSAIREHEEGKAIYSMEYLSVDEGPSPCVGCEYEPKLVDCMFSGCLKSKTRRDKDTLERFLEAEALADKIFHPFDVALFVPLGTTVAAFRSCHFGKAGTK